MESYVVCAGCERVNRVAIERAQAGEAKCGHCKQPLVLHAGVQEVSASGLQRLVQQSKLPVVVDFWAPWCAPCVGFAPTFEKAALGLAGKFVFAKLNTEAQPQVNTTYQIRGIPTLIVFKNGQEAGRQAGALSLPMLGQYLAQFG